MTDPTVAAWTRENERYTDGRAEQAWAQDEITYGIWNVPESELHALPDLAGKDVVLAFVESYGRVAVDGPESTGARTLLDDGTARLRRLGYTASSGWLTSPTFGGSSWLAHSTFQSGLTVGDQVRYDRLLESPRTTLSSAFSRAGWRTVAVLPSTRGP